MGNSFRLLTAAVMVCAGQAAAQDGGAGSAAPAAEGAVAPESPSLGMGLNGIADWSVQLPFLDLMKSARPWLGHTPETWGAWDNARLAEEGYLSPEGWPTALPPGVDRLETFVLTELPEETAESTAGTYVLRWEGTAAVTVGGRAQLLDEGEQSLRFDYTPGPGLVAVTVTSIDPADPLREMTLVREDRLALHEGGAVFNPDFLDLIEDFRALRFMDWMVTNGSTQVTWDDRPEVGDASWMQGGVPLEIMVQLANEVGADPWFTLPHQADDDYVARFAGYVRDHLDPRLRVHAEWSNEVWNGIFPQAQWALEQAQARWGAAAEDDGWMQFAGLRAAEVADIWAAAFGAEAEERLVRVVAVHTGWLGLEEPLLTAPLAVEEGRPQPVESFDAYAVTGYFSGDVGTEERAPEVHEWLEAGTAAERVAEIARADLERLTGTLWPHHAEVARSHGLDLMAYEGGTHIVGLGPVVEDQAITDLFTTFNYSPEVAELYGELLTEWTDVGGTLFMHFVDVASPSRWGSWGALRHLDDANPRWDALLEANAVAPGWDSRDPQTFANGLRLMGSDAGETLTGTPEEDDLIGLAGDDVLISLGGADRLHGGEGHDIARLPGAEADWTRSEDGPATLLTRAGVTLRLTEVEEVAFE